MNEKYKNLSYEEKIAILTGAAEWDKCAERFGVVRTKFIEAEEANEKILGGSFPRSEALADTWDFSLIEEIALAVSCEAKKKNYGSIIAPRLGIAYNSYADGLAEDSRFVAEFARAYFRGIARAGMPAFATGISLPPKSSLTGDKITDERTRDGYLRPLKALVAENLVSGVVLGNYSEYEEVRTVCGLNVRFVCENALGKDAVKCINAGMRVLSGDTFFANNAYKKFLAFEDNVKKGTADAEIFKNLCEEGELLSEEAIDGALEKFIEFDRINAENAAPTPGYDLPRLLERAAAESFVLIKNARSVLPIAPVSSVAIVGNVYEVKGLIEEFGRLRIKTYFCDGYKRDSDEIVLLSEKDKAEIECCDAVIFIADGLRKNEKSAEMAANRSAVANMVAGLARKSVAVAVGKRVFDVAGLDCFDGIFVSKGCGEYCGQILADMLLGTVIPSGRLTRTYMTDTDETEKRRKIDCAKTKTHTGEFYGYKYFDASELDNPYAFGFGLNYGKCTITSGSSEDGKSVNVTVRNDGTTDICETLQLYVGKRESNIVRPVKEYVSSKKVSVGAKQTRVVSFQVSMKDIAVRNENAEEVESGGYFVYIGTSASDIEITKTMYVGGRGFTRSKTKPTDFLSSKPNITTDGYVIGEGEALMKNSKKLSILARITLIATILFDVVVALLVSTGALSFGGGGFLSALIIMILIVCHAFTFTTMGIAVNVRKKNEEAEKLLAEIKSHDFDHAETVSGDDTDTLFKEEFFQDPDEPVSEETKAEEEYTEFDKNIKMSDIAGDLRKFLLERGLSIELDDVRAILSTIASSKLIYACDGGDKTARIWRAIAEYFGNAPYMIDCAAFKPMSGVNVIRCMSEIDQKTSDAVCFCVFNNVTENIAGNCFSPVYPYFSSPKNVRKLSAKQNGQEFTVNISPKIWCVLIFKDERVFENLSDEFIARGEYFDFSARDTEKDPHKTIFKRIGFNQFSLMADIAREKFSADEKRYKEIDKFESRLKDYGYALGNKDWQTIENYVGTYLASGGNEDSLLDLIVSQKLLPIAENAVACGGREKFALEVLDECFGKENIPRTMKIIGYFSRKKIDSDDNAVNAEQSAQKASVNEAKPEQRAKETNANAPLNANAVPPVGDAAE